jgi:1-acyl-sn-glycerol-3-phosphate acyltransferase
MKSFTDAYRKYLDTAGPTGVQFGFDIETVARFEPLLSLMYKAWWRVKLNGLDQIPEEGPAFLVGNGGTLFSCPGFMLMYALMSKTTHPRRLNVLAELDWIQDESLRRLLREIGFVQWSADNARELLKAGELVCVFPEGLAGSVKPPSESNRLRPFDWTMFMPALEAGVNIYPVTTLGCDEAAPVLANLESLASFMKVPVFPITPFFPWLPFPLNMLSLPIEWHMAIDKPVAVKEIINPKDDLVTHAKAVARLSEGKIQADLNKLLRAKIKA